MDFAWDQTVATLAQKKGAPQRVVFSCILPLLPEVVAGFFTLFAVDVISGLNVDLVE